MAEFIPKLQRTICDLTNFLSLIMKRGPEARYEDDEAPMADSHNLNKRDIDAEEKEEPVDETEFEDAAVVGDIVQDDQWFCEYSQRTNLARKYLVMSSSTATFDDIVVACEAGSLADLMRTHGVDMSDVDRHGIQLQSPPPGVYHAYRLMIDVEHALSGRFCRCFNARPSPACHNDCHQGYETHIDSECDVNYGFHLTWPWERWQLLNFYEHLFQQPGFDPCRMAEALENTDLEALEN